MDILLVICQFLFFNKYIYTCNQTLGDYYVAVITVGRLYSITYPDLVKCINNFFFCQVHVQALFIYSEAERSRDLCTHFCFHYHFLHLSRVVTAQPY